MHGHLALISSHTRRLIYQALRRRDFGLLAQAADLAVPPLGVLAVANIALLLMSLAWLVGARAPLAFATVASALFASYLLAGWYVCGRRAYRPGGSPTVAPGTSSWSWAPS
jgi:hypothetical protein